MIRLAASVLAPIRGFRFPARAIGGWWWVWRYRFEMLVGWYEFPTTLWLRRLLRPAMIVADVGAHIGYFSLLMARLVSSSGKVLAFEPSPENFPLLLHDVSRARAGNVVCIQAAVADTRGAATLYVSPGHSNHSLVRGYTQAQGTILVATTSLDDYLAASGESRLDLIKIDAEGAEPMILDGMICTISANPHLVMILEVNPAALAAAGVSPQSLIRRIAGQGLVPRLIGPDGQLLDPQNQSFDGGPNLLCMRAKEWERLPLRI